MQHFLASSLSNKIPRSISISKMDDGDKTKENVKTFYPKQNGRTVLSIVRFKFFFLNGRTDGWTVWQMDEPTGRWTNRREDWWTDGQMDGSMDRCTDQWPVTNIRGLKGLILFRDVFCANDPNIPKIYQLFPPFFCHAFDCYNIDSMTLL